MEFVTHSVEETEAAAEQLVAWLLARRGTQGTGTLVALSGELGAGKTAFVKGVAKALGITESVTSPTFVLEKVYKIETEPFSHLIHIDAYRLEGGGELNAIGWHEAVTNPKNLIFVEWPEKVADEMPNRALTLNFEVIDPETRKISTEFEM